MITGSVRVSKSIQRVFRVFLGAVVEGLKRGESARGTTRQGLVVRVGFRQMATPSAGLP